MNPISEKLSEIRQVNRLSQKEMADHMGVAQSTYNSYEAGKSEPRYSELMTLVQRLNLNPMDLFGPPVGATGMTLADLALPAGYREPTTRADIFRLEKRIARAEAELKTYLEALAEAVHELRSRVQ